MIHLRSFNDGPLLSYVDVGTISTVFVKLTVDSTNDSMSGNGVIFPLLIRIRLKVSRSVHLREYQLAAVGIMYVILHFSFHRFI